MKYFYTDSLAVQWMAEKFGMKFVTPAGEKMKWDGVEKCYYTDSHPEKWDAAYCVASESLHLLAPRLGDLVISNATKGIAATVIDLGILSILEKSEHVSDVGIQIILREGRAFMWPECEK